MPVLSVEPLKSDQHSGQATPGTTSQDVGTFERLGATWHGCRSILCPVSDVLLLAFELGAFGASPALLFAHRLPAFRDSRQGSLAMHARSPQPATNDRSCAPYTAPAVHVDHVALSRCLLNCIQNLFHLLRFQHREFHLKQLLLHHNLWVT